MFKIGHRGAKGYAPENTLASFRKAIDLKVDAIEFDVQLSKDGKVVIMHDPWLMRTTKSFGSIKSRTLTELKKLNAGKNETIPTLEESLDLINRQTKVLVELKGKNTALPVSKIINRYVEKKGWKYDDFLVLSWDINEVRKFKKLIPQIKTGISVFGFNVQLDRYITELDAYSVHLWSKLVKKTVVEKAHKKGLKVFAYTVNSVEEIKKMKSLGVDGIFSDYPDRING